MWRPTISNANTAKRLSPGITPPYECENPGHAGEDVNPVRALRCVLSGQRPVACKSFAISQRTRGALFSKEWIWSILKQIIAPLRDEFIDRFSTTAPVVVVVDDYDAALAYFIRNRM